MSGAAIQINYSIPNQTLVNLYSYYIEHYFMFCNLDEKKIIDSFIIGGIRDLIRNDIYPNEHWMDEFDIKDSKTYQHNDYLILLDEARHIWNSYYNKCQSIVYSIDGGEYSEHIDALLTQCIIRKSISYFVMRREYGCNNLIQIFLDEDLIKRIVQNLPTVDSDYLMNIEQYLEYLVEKDIMERKDGSK